jgi:hypothetical protein
LSTAAPDHAAIVEDAPDQASTVTEFRTPCFGAADQFGRRGGMSAEKGQTQDSKPPQQPCRVGVQDPGCFMFVPLR